MIQVCARKWNLCEDYCYTVFFLLYFLAYTAMYLKRNYLLNLYRRLIYTLIFNL